MRELLWRRGQDLDADKHRQLAKDLKSLSVEALIGKSWIGYAPLMLRRRDAQWRVSGDRRCTVAVDGNAKLHRRTCGQPFAEATLSFRGRFALLLSTTVLLALVISFHFLPNIVPVQVVPCDAVGKYLIRGCSNRPSGKDTLCQAHAAARDAQVQPMYAEIEAHRLVRALHAPDDVQFLEIKMLGFRGWQPSCTIPEANLQQYFAKKADERIRLRRYCAQTHRNQRKISAKPMRPKTFLSSWSSVCPKQASSCATHKESDKDVVAAARTAGFLFAISHSGLVVHLEELIGAESLSQRYAFLLHVLQQFPDLQTVVHDDSCHLHFMAQSQKSGSVLAEQASKLTFIVDAFHSAGHVGQWCKAHLMPDLPANKEKLAGFPTSIAEVVNASFSPLKHTIHHMGCFMAKFVLTELVDVHNIKVLSSVKVGHFKLEKVNCVLFLHGFL